MRKGLAALAILVSAAGTAALAPPASAQVSFGFSTPGFSIGVNLNSYPELVRIPGYPVYYAPNLGTNYFFYDGMYWVFDGTNWYASTWYDGPWEIVYPDEVPFFLLRVPVRYYVAPPVYFRSWSVSGPPRWGEHWGRRWEERHRNWDRWNRNDVPPPAPLPTYQRQYTGNRYPTLAEQHALESSRYHYRPRDQIVQRAFTARVQHAEAAPQGRRSSAQQAQTQRAQQAQASQQQQAQAQQRRAERTQQAQTRQREQAQAQPRETQQAQVRQREQTQGTQRAQAERTQQAQMRQQEQAQARTRQQGQVQRQQQAQARRQQQAEGRQQQAQARQRAERQQQAQVQRPQQPQARQQAQAQRDRQQAERQQQAQAQRESQNRRERQQQGG